MKKLTILIALVLLGACTPKKQGVKANTTSNSNVSINGISLSSQCGSVQTLAERGSVYDNTGFDFDARVKALLSSYLQPSEVGTVSGLQGTPGVRFSGKIKLDSNGAVVGTQSNLTIQVEDSFFLYSGAKAIELKFSQSGTSSITGQFNLSSGQGSLIVQDEDGQIKFDGTIDAQKFSGTVSFQNSKTVVGGSPASGTLGQFWVTTCGFIQ